MYLIALHDLKPIQLLKITELLRELIIDNNLSF